MEIVVEPNRFQQVLNTALIGGMLESVTGYFRPDGLYIEDQSLQGTAVKAFFPKQFFIEYKTAEGEEKICLQKIMKEPFGFHEAFEKEKIKVKTKENKIFYLSMDEADKSNEFWRSDLEAVTEKLFGTKIEPSEKGYVPTHAELQAQFLVRIGQLRVHKSERYKFICDGNKVEIEVYEPGVYRRLLNLVKQHKLTPLESAIPGETLETIVDLFSGEVWVTIFGKAVVFSQKTKEGTILTYIISPFSE